MAHGIKLWLDDNRPAPEGWVWVKYAPSAATYLLTSPVEEMSLDCDLDNPECERCQFRCGLRDQGQCQHACPCHEQGRMNGLSLVNWMTRVRLWPAKKPVVHSTNAEYAQKMQQLIDTNFPGSQA